MKKVSLLFSMTTIFFLMIVMMTGSGTVYASSQFLTTFNSTYGTSGTVLNTCGVCHINPAGGGTRNPFGTDFASASIGNHTFNTALNNRDSDGDTYTNLTEINARTFPGDATSHPTTSGGGTTTVTTPPTVTATGGGSNGISGVVKDIVTGAAISGALVSDGTQSTTTGSSGTYSLSEATGNYTLTVSKSGYLTTKQVATVTAGATKTVNWALTRSYGTQAIPAANMNYVIFAWNDLGMHCDQDDYSYFMVLPPYNTLKAQVFRRGSEGASLVTSGVTVSYSFPKKTNSALHTNFWAFAPQFGFNVPINVGISGTPLAGNMKLAADGKSWEAVGIPITPYDDDGTWDPYGTAVVTVNNSSGSTLQTVNVVAPVSTEMMCSNCHGTVNPQLDILQRHDAAMGTTFVADRAAGKVHACAECHSQNALGAAGKAGIPSLSQAMHSFHTNKISAADQASTAGCYNCHPGPKTQCMRGIMARAGKTCSDCHGDMTAVATSIMNGRRPWLDMPKCGDCHGAAHAENTNTLYRNSLLMNAPAGSMNGKIYCEACHNSTHAELTTANPADPTIPQKFQGDTYWIWNCAVCHGSSSSQTMHISSQLSAPPNGAPSNNNIVWKQAVSGQVYIWNMNGTAIAFQGSLATISDLNWGIKGVGDFNGDGKKDILWRHDLTGQVYVWLMNDTTIASQGSPGTVGDLNWEIKGVGDFNGDGKKDILWRHDLTGQVMVWLMNGTTITSQGLPATVSDLNWEIRGVGDFNGDGKADILWRHKVTGQVYVWLMNGTTITSQSSPTTVSDLNWEIRGVGDFNGDGKADILWRHKVTGQVYIWLMNGTTITSQSSPATVNDQNWEIKVVDDYNGDNFADICWRHKASGQVYLWLMNGTTIAAQGSPGTVGDLNWDIQKY